MDSRLTGIAVVCALLLLTPMAADAGPRDQLRDSREQHEPRGDDRRAAAARKAQQRNGGGRVLAVDPDGAGYRVKLLKEGEVRTLFVTVD